MLRRGAPHTGTVYSLLEQFVVPDPEFNILQTLKSGESFISFPHKNSFQDSNSVFTVVFENVCKPTALVSECLSPNALRRETVSGRAEAVLPMRSQPGLETEHTSQDGGVWGQDTTPISVGLQDKPGGEGGVQNAGLQAPSRHLDSASRGGTRNGVLKWQPGFLPLLSGPCPSPKVPACLGSQLLSVLAPTLSPGAAGEEPRVEPALPDCLARGLLAKAGCTSERAPVLFTSTDV